MCGPYTTLTVITLVGLMLLATAMWGTYVNINNGTVTSTTAGLVWTAFALIGYWWLYIFFKCDMPDHIVCDGKAHIDRRLTVHPPVTSQMIVTMLETINPCCWPKFAVQGLFWCASNMCKPSTHVSELAKAQEELANVKAQLAAVQATALAPSAPPSQVGDPKV